MMRRFRLWLCRLPVRLWFLTFTRAPKHEAWIFKPDRCLICCRPLEWRHSTHSGHCRKHGRWDVMLMQRWLYEEMLRAKP